MLYLGKLSSCSFYVVQYVCSCIEGYHGNGTHCVANDVCSQENGGCHSTVNNISLVSLESRLGRKVGLESVFLRTWILACTCSLRIWTCYLRTCIQVSADVIITLGLAVV